MTPPPLLTRPGGSSPLATPRMPRRIWRRNIVIPRSVAPRCSRPWIAIGRCDTCEILPHADPHIGRQIKIGRRAAPGGQYSGRAARARPRKDNGVSLGFAAGAEDEVILAQDGAHSERR